MVFFCKQKTAYEMRISDWSSDVCSSDLHLHGPDVALGELVDLLLHRAGVGIHIDGAGVDLALALALAHGTFPIAVCPGTWRTCPCGICWRRQRGRFARQSRPLPRAPRRSACRACRGRALGLAGP